MTKKRIKRKISRQEAIEALRTKVREADGSLVTRCITDERLYKTVIFEHMLTPVSLYDEGLVETDDIISTFISSYVIHDMLEELFELADLKKYISRFMEETGESGEMGTNKLEEVLNRFYNEIYDELKKHQDKVVKIFFRMYPGQKWENIPTEKLQAIHGYIIRGCKIIP
ncbi:hypothetical protein Calow_2038 [Caldicellulosiruptor owensensis OL]|uniref:Uncharacterized protein n=1 Tax=Caldicellulosiruptor owensensis (strain ATCC 700167 / DSM 13100 / OL) TaxID=632518 RepID=E4Q664_CALOW|nr:hypothetical protein [Caldicellulosiruptor owensensis]ADQ05549.1 hypothetical protein Calow_2038 [Caldicellulosiruptor owensensis OL]